MTCLWIAQVYESNEVQAREMVWIFSVFMESNRDLIPSIWLDMVLVQIHVYRKFILYLDYHRNWLQFERVSNLFLNLMFCSDFLVDGT